MIMGIECLLFAQNLLDQLFVCNRVATFEPYLGVPDDAAGVQNVGRSPVGILPAEIGTMAVENRICNSQFLGCLPGLVRVGKHRNREHQQAIFCVAVVEFLEMDHLPTGELSKS